MSLKLELQNVSESDDVPAEREFRGWAFSVLKGCRENAELVIRIVDEPEMTELNRDYRGKDGPTNVLSFPFEAPPPVPSDLIGDIVICAPLVHREAAQQHKPALAHWAHLVVHGVLHLLGYDHVDESGAVGMETLEKDILGRLGYPDPYQPR